MSNKFLNFLVFATGITIVLWNKLFLCQIGSGLGFDQQSFMFWDYAKSLKLVPYKQFFYPYGLLFYLKIDSVFWNIISLIIILLIYLAVLKIFKQIFKDKTFSVIFFLSFCIFTSIFLDFDSLLRYGLIIPVSYCFSNLTFKKTFFRRENGLILGIILGLLFSFANDIFIYCSGVFIFFAIYNVIFIYKKIYKELLKFFVFSLIGFCLGLLPIIIFLQNNHALQEFIQNFGLLRYVSLFAKIPFPPTLKSFENLLTLSSIVFGIIFLLQKKEKTFNYFIVLSLTVSLLLLEQKNILRSTYEQISTLGFLLFLVLLSQIIILFKKKNVDTRFLIMYSLILILLVFGMIYTERGYRRAYSVSFIGKSCIDRKVSSINKNELESYLKIKNSVPINKKIFSFPGDPIFYVLFKQLPPPYPSIYESTPKYAQSQQIEYINKNNIDFVIINSSSGAIQDGVPDKIRAELLYSYINRNFKLYKKIDKFIILQRKN